MALMFKLMSKKCGTCILNPAATALPLPPGRLREFVNSARTKDTHVVCHEAQARQEDIACRGYWDAFGPGQLGRIAGRLNAIEEVDPCS